MKISTQLPIKPTISSDLLKPQEGTETITKLGAFNSTQRHHVEKESEHIELKPDSVPLTITDLSIEYHQETGLLQSIVTENLTEDIIRKIPSDEYLDLLRLVDEYLTENIDQQI